jgi:hypothetical protein
VSELPSSAGGTAAWIRRRTRNVYRRPWQLITTGSATFVLSLLVFILVPRSARHRAELLAAERAQRPDTIPLVLERGRAAARVDTAERALEGARAELERQRATPADTLSLAQLARRDSLAAASANLARLLTRVQEAPLTASYRALAAAPELRADRRVAKLVDSLDDVEKARADFGAVGGVDPIFVALTARATQIGREIQQVAVARRVAIRRELDAFGLPPAPKPAVAIDTIPLVTARDSASEAVARIDRQLRMARAMALDLEARERRARESADAGAAGLAVLGASAVIGAAVAFAVGLLLEFREPRVASQREAMELAGARVLTVVRPQPPNPERQRRRADREIPPSIDQLDDRYAPLYAHFASATYDLPLVSVISDSSAAAAAVALNLAAVAARSARTALVIDADVTIPRDGIGGVARVARVREEPGLDEVLSGKVGWPEAVRSIVVGRDRTVDVLPAGAGRSTADPSVQEQIRSEVTQLARRYDTVALSSRARADGVPAAVIAGATPAVPVVIVVRVARTPVRTLQGIAATLDAAGAEQRALVLWAVEDPGAQAVRGHPERRREAARRDVRVSPPAGEQAPAR